MFSFIPQLGRLCGLLAWQGPFLFSPKTRHSDDVVAVAWQGPFFLKKHVPFQTNMFFVFLGSNIGIPGSIFCVFG